MTQGRIDFDEAKFPIVYVRYADGFTTEEWISALECVHRLLSRAEPFAMIHDIRAVKAPPTPHERRLAVEFNKDNETLMRKYVAAWANVSSSTIIRGVITAMGWIQKPAFAQKQFDDMEGALRWAQMCLDRPRQTLRQ